MRRNVTPMLHENPPKQRPATAIWMAVAMILAATPAAGVRAADADAWSADHVDVTETVDGQAGTVTTRLETATAGDVRISVDLSDGRTHTKGSILLIAGKWLASRDLPQQPAQPLDYVDAAALNSQLVLALLRAGAPQGPPAPGKTATVSVTEPSRAIHVSTATASGDFAAPWTLSGTVKMPGVKALAEYRLMLRYRADGRDASIHISGAAGVAVPPFDVPDDMPLTGWKIFRLTGGRYSAEDAAGTVGELRKRK